MADDAVHNLENGLSYMLRSLNPLGLRWSLVFFPWKIAVYWLSICLSFLLELCAIAGAPPSGYVTRNQVIHRLSNQHLTTACALDFMTSHHASHVDAAGKTTELSG